MPHIDQPILLFDCDPGCDDALALAMVVRRQLVKSSPYREVNILCVAGNVSVDQTVSNAVRILTAYLLDQTGSKKKEDGADKMLKCFKVFRGCSQSMDGKDPSAASVHGRDGLGDAPNCLIWERQAVAQKSRRAFVQRKTSAVERYLAFVRDPVVSTLFDLLCTGPLTNLANALNLMSARQQKMFWENCRHVVIMGGAFGIGGNITHSAEFNTFADPTATQVVLDSFAEFSNDKRCVGNKRLHFVSLDVTEQVAILLDHKNDANPTTRAAKFLRYALKQYGQFHVFHCKRPKITDQKGRILDIGEFSSQTYAEAQMAGSNGDGQLNRFCYLHDPLAAWILFEDLLGKRIWQEAEIRIETGLGQSRGRIILCEQRARHETIPLPIMSHGLKVKWLDPAKFGGESKRKFIDEVAQLLEVNRSWYPTSSNTALHEM